MSLKNSTFSGVIWTVADTFFLKGLTFIASVMLARLLGPDEFGLIGMISVFIAIGIAIVNSGLSSSLIRTKNADDSDYSTVFYLNLFLAILAFLIFFMLAPLISHFYKQRVLTDIIRLYCLSFLFSSFSAVQLAILNKKMQFKKITILNIPGTVGGVVLGIVLGYLGFGVWSIVWMYLSTQFINSLTIWFFSNWKPGFIFSVEKMKYHFSFGYKLLLSSLINTVFNNVYNVVIGKFYSVQLLGYFERARTFNEYPATILTGVIEKVTYPLLSNIQDDKLRIAEIYKQLLQFSFFVTAPVMFAAAAISYPLFELILGSQWLPAAKYFQIICLASMFYPVHAFNINILKVYGRSDLFLKLEIIKKVVIVLGILVSFPFGILALVWSSVIASLISLIINMYYSSDMIAYKSFQQIKDMFPTFLIGLFTFFGMYAIVLLLQNYSLYFQILMSGLFGILFFILVNFIFKPMPMLFALKLFNHTKL
ncbi:lipopolysaccharide biosynthesis protein [Chryseobacterium terrae]|uniref:Lipopolysaccharide biosynthesis protein n=1 Tax=Chryseobacterium terrae TaxID=3163299 RepID=A0ABW8Y634_9FLAO